ncbi:hypothetical protein LTR84_006985 [Exophiala bonariae]|uniref:Zn(2)-C6 fungal-type domain-containing protein n=1 Tax=Exophiala bonariae TaxID=1690606 RepID=A0AAV9MZA9_9EURO|nr:hypothetical protein LTR84_006985 [Exophiala bonariae]
MAPPNPPGENNTQSTSSERDRDFAVSKRSRGKTGCLNCRRRRKKCDESKPTCQKCTTRGDSCEWDTGYTFRLSSIDTYHHPMANPRNPKAQRDSQITNVGSGNITESSQQSGTQHSDTVSQSSREPYNELSDEDAEERQTDDDNIPLAEDTRALKPSSEAVVPSSMQEGVISISPTLHQRTVPAAQTSPYQTAASGSTGGTRSALINQGDGKTNLDSFPRSVPGESTARSPIEMTATPGRKSLGPFNRGTIVPPRPAIMSSELEALDYLTIQADELNMFASPPDQAPHVQNYPWNDSDVVISPFAVESTHSAEVSGNLYPSATYQHLHTTLYNHMVETARTTTLTRQTSPDPLSQGDLLASQDALSSSVDINKIRTPAGEPSLRLQPLKHGRLTQRRQLELWRNYLDEIAPWLDMFDGDRNFQVKIPLLAKSADHLHYAVLALSARQMERKDPDKPYTESLGLYQEAIQLIVKELESLDTSTIASCVLLCVLEMMSSSPRAWGRHLSGCAMLLQAAGVNGVVGGVRQSLFWCFARMDVWGGYLQDTFTKIPTNRWFLPSGFMVDAVNHFRGISGRDSYANYAVFLCANVINVISISTGPDAGQAEQESRRGNTNSARWRALFDLLEDWYNGRPEEMQPLMAYPSTVNEPEEPFPVVLYGNSPAINGNQLYHAAAILMLQNKPKDIRLSKSPKSILWHARQICGTAVSNCDHGAWINSLQPLWIAGKIMSHETEHRVILDLLMRVERDTGWATSWRAEDLKEYWGEGQG